MLGAGDVGVFPGGDYRLEVGDAELVLVLAWRLPLGVAGGVG